MQRAMKRNRTIDKRETFQNIHADPGPPDLGSERGEAGHNVVGPGTQVKTSSVHLYCTMLYR